MAVVTIDGQIGSGAPEIGALVAIRLETDYVDRLVMAEAAKRIGAPVEVVEQKILESSSRMARLSRLFKTLLERSAMSGTGGDPYFGAGWDNLMTRPYNEADESEITSAQELDDQRFISTYKEVITDLAKMGNVVIIGHGSCMLLKDHPQALHVGLVADIEYRIGRIMNREGLERSTAEKYTMAQEKGRVTYFKRFFKVNANDPTLYQVVLNMSAMKDNYAEELIAQAAISLDKGEFN